MTRVIVVDDHKVFREGIISILKDAGDIQVCGEAGDGRELLDLLGRQAADVILLDISMGDTTNGIITTQILKERFPGIKVLILSMHSESHYILKALEAGASGYLLKDAGSQEMINAIHTVAGGGSYYSSEVSAALVAQLTHPVKPRPPRGEVPLTPREVEVLKLIAEEYSNPEIAEKLFISIRTVDTHRRNLIEKLGVKNTAGLVKYALKHGLIKNE